MNPARKMPQSGSRNVPSWLANIQSHRKTRSEAAAPDTSPASTTALVVCSDTPLAEVEAKSSNGQEDRKNHRHHDEAAVDAVFRIESSEPETNDAEHDERAEITCECEERSHASSGRERTDHDVIPIRITECEFHGAGIGVQIRLLLQSRDKRAGPKQRLIEVVHTKEQE